jgi:hypothetical protein
MSTGTVTIHTFQHRDGEAQVEILPNGKPFLRLRRNPSEEWSGPAHLRSTTTEEIRVPEPTLEQGLTEMFDIVRNLSGVAATIIDSGVTPPAVLEHLRAAETALRQATTNLSHAVSEAGRGS